MNTNKDKTYAVIGASSNPDKYGFKVLKYLKDQRLRVIPINLKGGEILDLKAYASVLDYADKIDVAVLVTQPNVTLQVLKQVQQKGIQKVWLQPGSESDEAIELCKASGIECIHHACIMLK